MASWGGGAERAAAAVNDLIEAREGAARIRSLLQEEGSPWTELMDGMLNKLSSALSALDTGAAGAAEAEGQSSAAGAGAEADGARLSATPSSRNGTRKRSFSRSHRPASSRVTATLDDGHVWRKYGQKEIQNSPHPRSYYRCTHKSDQGCNAKRHVQLCETEPFKFVVTYYGEHSCRDPSTIPMLVDVATAGAATPSNLISFGPAAAHTSAASNSHVSKEGTTISATRLSSSWGASDDVVSSSGAEPFVQVDELAAVVGSAGRTSSTVGSGPPDYGGLADMAPDGGGGGTGSLPSSPRSPGAFLGIADDLFWFDR